MLLKWAFFPICIVEGSIEKEFLRLKNTVHLLGTIILA